MIATTKFVNHNSHLESIASTQSTAISHRSRLVERTLSQSNDILLAPANIHSKRSLQSRQSSEKSTLGKFLSTEPAHFIRSRLTETIRTSSAAAELNTSKRYGSIHRADPVLRVQSAREDCFTTDHHLNMARGPTLTSQSTQPSHRTTPYAIAL
ncbi:unnamed protein product [Jaminaea pallidilutea]